LGRFPRFIADDGPMSSLSWVASPILIIVTIVLAALRLRRRAHVPLAILAVAAGFSLLGLAAERLAIAVIHRMGIRNGLPWAVIGGLTIIAVYVETFHYVSFRAGPSMRAHRSSGGAVMAGLGYGAMSIFRGTRIGSDSRADEEPVAK
jgi:uncharacterized membrane protein YjfL (UPF0719 family)